MASSARIRLQVQDSAVAPSTSVVKGRLGDEIRRGRGSIRVAGALWEKLFSHQSSRQGCRYGKGFGGWVFPLDTCVSALPVRSFLGTGGPDVLGDVTITHPRGSSRRLVLFPSVLEDLLPGTFRWPRLGRRR